MISLALVVVACSPAGSGSAPTTVPATTPASAPATEPASPGASPTGPAVPGADQTPAPPDPAAPLWRTAVLRDVVSGAEFRIDDLRGQVVVIEPMAIWCFTCRLQQRESREALGSIDTSGVFYLSLDIDPRERESDLAEYAASQGFDWHFAVAPAEVSRSLADEFGEQVLSPPSTPLIVIDPDGNVVHQSFGIVSAADLARLILESAS